MNRQPILRFCLTSIVALMVSQSILADIDSGLVTHLTFDGHAQDVSGQGHHAATFGVVPTADRFGNPNSAYLFDGKNDYVLASATGLPGGERTVSLWFRADRGVSGDSVSQVLLGYGGNGPTGTSWWMSVSPDLYSLGLHWPGSFTMNYAHGENLRQKWKMLTVVTSTAGTTFYVDGTAVATDSFFVDQTYAMDRKLAIGVAVDGYGEAPFTSSNLGYFEGAIDDVRIYDRALSDDEVSALFSNAPNKPPVAVAGTSLTSGGKIQLDSVLSLDPDEDTLTYQWLLEGEGDYRYGQTISLEDLAPGEYLASLTVDDGRGGVSTDWLHFAISSSGDFVQNDLDEAYRLGWEDGRLVCHHSPESCGIDMNAATEIGHEQGRASCINEPSSCGLFDQELLDEKANERARELALLFLDELPRGQYVSQCQKNPDSIFCDFLGQIPADDEESDYGKCKGKDKGKGKGKGKDKGKDKGKRKKS